MIIASAKQKQENFYLCYTLSCTTDSSEDEENELYSIKVTKCGEANSDANCEKCISDPLESASANQITRDKAKALKIFTMLQAGSVTPMTLNDIIEDAFN